MPEIKMLPLLMVCNRESGRVEQWARVELPIEPERYTVEQAFETRRGLETRMLFGFIGRISSANQLKENLDLSTQRTRGIAQRVAGATLQNQAGFAMPNGEVVSQPEAVNLEAEMTSLADEQLRYEATAKLLEKTYQQIRVSMRDR